MPITKKITTGVLTDDLITSDKVANEFTTISSLTPGQVLMLVIRLLKYLR